MAFTETRRCGVASVSSLFVAYIREDVESLREFLRERPETVSSIKESATLAGLLWVGRRLQRVEMQPSHVTRVIVGAWTLLASHIVAEWLQLLLDAIR